MIRWYFAFIVFLSLFPTAVSYTYSGLSFAADNGFGQENQSKINNKKIYGKWNIVLEDSSILSERTIDTVAQEYFRISPDSGKRLVRFTEVLHLTKIYENSTVTGIISGTIIGFLIGSSWDTNDKGSGYSAHSELGYTEAVSTIGNAFLGTIIGASVLGIVGALLDIDKEFDLSHTPIDQKATVIHNIFQGTK